MHVYGPFDRRRRPPRLQRAECRELRLAGGYGSRGAQGVSGRHRLGRSRHAAVGSAARHAALHRVVRYPRQGARRAHRDHPDSRVPRRGPARHARSRRSRLGAPGDRGEHGGWRIERRRRGRSCGGVWNTRRGQNPLAPDTRYLEPSGSAAVKFLCVECDQQMAFGERKLPGDGTLAATFKCPKCGRVVAMLTNPMETQLVSSLGVEIGGRTVPSQPLETVRKMVATGRDDAFDEDSEPRGHAAGQYGPPTWSAAAQERLTRVPNFVRGMVKKIYADYAKERGITEITPAIMDTARAELGLEGM